jgi:hypothetical protein
MTNVQLYLKYSGSEISGVFSFSVNNIIDARGNATFKLSNFQNKEYKTWITRHDEYIEIWERSTTKLVFAGWITSVSNGNPIILTADGYIAALSFYILDENNSNLIIDSGKIQSCVGTTTNCLTQESVDPAFVNDQYNTSAATPRYFIVSDSTKNDATLERSPTANSTLTNGHTEGGSTADLVSENTTYWIIHGDALQSTLTVVLKFEIEDAGVPIQKTSSITSVRINCKGYIGNGDAGEWYQLYLYWKSPLSSYNVMLGSINFGFGNTPFDIDQTVKKYLPYLFSVGADFWEGGQLYAVIITKATQLGSIHLCFDYVKITINYVTTSFDTINLKITDTVATNDIICGTSELGDLGVGANDSWSIAVGVTEALHRCFMGIGAENINHIINNGTLIDKGATFNELGATGLDMFISICKQNSLHYFNDYQNVVADTPFVVAVEEDEMTAATVTYDKDNDPPSAEIKIDVPNEEFGSVVVVYNGGITEHVSSTSTNKKTKVIINRNIITYAEAMALATKEAAYYATQRYSIQLEWNSLPTNLPQTGCLYNITIPSDDNADGVPEATIAYTDVLCRRVTIEQMGDLSSFHITAWFGTASTPSNEKTGKIIAQNERRLNVNERLSLSTPFAPVTRHPQLLGIAGSSEGVHVSAAERALIIAPSDTAYAGSWNGVTTIAPSKNAVYDKIEALIAAFNAALMLGSANSAWVPMVLELETVVGKILNRSAYDITNADTTDVSFSMLLPLPTNRGGKKLYIKGIRVMIWAAAATYYLNQIIVYGVRYNAATELLNDGTDRTSANLYTYAFAAADVSSYNEIKAFLTFESGGGTWRIIGAEIDSYYDT